MFSLRAVDGSLLRFGRRQDKAEHGFGDELLVFWDGCQGFFPYMAKTMAPPVFFAPVQ